MRTPSLALLLCMMTQTAHADTCQQGATLTYPVSQSILSAASMVDIARYQTVDAFASIESIINPSPADQVKNLDAALTAAQATLSQLKQPERDMLVLAMLEFKAHEEVPLFVLLFFDNAYAIPLYLDALERNDLNQHATIIRRAIGLFGPPDMPYQTRYDMWLASRDGDADPRLAARFEGLTQRFNALPTPMETALDLLESDIALSAKYERFRQSTSDNYRYSYLLDQVYACADLNAIYTSLAAPDAMALPQPQQDIIRLSVIEWEAADGGFTEYFSSPLADDTGLAITLLDAYGLTEQADALRTGMAQFPTPFPTSAYTRENYIYNVMSPQDAESFFYMGSAFHNSDVRDKVIALAKDANLWPE